VEVPPFAKQLPAGTTHLDVPHAFAACKVLGIDFAQALVGFEPSRGGMLPKIQGVVVCNEHVEAVRSFAEEAEAARLEKAQQRRFAPTCTLGRGCACIFVIACL
jgi:xeroderma pigmentosum group C-complementing protein